MYIDPEDFQQYIYAEENNSRYCLLSPREQILLYYFEHLDENDQRTILGYIWAKVKH